MTLFSTIARFVKVKKVIVQQCCKWSSASFNRILEWQSKGSKFQYEGGIVFIFTIQSDLKYQVQFVPSPGLVHSQM